MEVIVFINTAGKWCHYLDHVYANHRLALEAIEHAPDQTASYSIYWKENGECIKNIKFNVFRYTQSVDGKKCVQPRECCFSWCLKADGFPFMFTEDL